MCDSELVSLGFAVMTADQSVIEEWFAQSFGRDPNEADWEKINADIALVERNAVEFLGRKLGHNVRAEGHSGDDNALVGSCWVALDNTEGLEYVHGYYEEWHPRCNDTETDEALLNGTSEFAGCINAEVEFFDIDEADMERIEAVTRPKKEEAD